MNYCVIYHNSIEFNNVRLIILLFVTFVLFLFRSSRKLSKGETIFALYPDTTSFYMAVISQAPRRTAIGVDPCVVVQFIGDEDASGWCLIFFVVFLKLITLCCCCFTQV